MKIVWLEDDATPGTEGHEGLCAAYNRLFGEAFVSANACRHEDCGDGDMYYMPNGAVVYRSYPGNSSIRVPEDQK